MRSPLYLSESLYAWDGAASGDHVSFDELHQRVIHHQRGGFSAIDIVEEGDPPDELFVKFDLEGIRMVRFSPDGMSFAYLSNKCTMGCVETLHPTREPISLSLKLGGGSRSDLEVLNFFWLPAMPQQTDYADLVIISTQGVEIFRVLFELHSAKSLKVFPVAVRLSWAEPTSGMVLVCIGARTLQPFDLRLKVPQKMPKFDLVVGRSNAIEANDVAVMTIYDATYCIHADAVNGRVSLRNISNPAQGTPERDIVIDVAEEEALVGTLRLSKVDNLLIVHCVERMASVIFDIRHKDMSAVPSICGPTTVATTGKGPSQDSWKDLLYVSGSTLVDSAGGMVFRLKVDMDSVLREFSARTPHDLATVIRLLLRRTNCREHIVDLLQRALTSKTSFSELSQAFAVANHAYRIAIEALSTRSRPGQTQQTTVSLQQLETVIGQQSILSEKDMVSQVFYPHFLASSGKDAPPPCVRQDAGGADAFPEETTRASGCGGCTSLADEGSFATLHDAWRIPLRPVSEEGALSVGAGRGGGCPARSPYLVSVVVAYLRSLLSMQILPHKILQCFVFDICMYFDQEHTLQQLLQYHVLLDSPELLLRLKEVATSRSRTWAVQAFLDMAHRLQDHCAVADMLLQTRQYLDIVPFLLNQQVTAFKLAQLLQRVDEDAEAKKDPDLMLHLVTEIQMWQQEALADPGVCVAPNLDGCEPWLSPGVKS